MLFAGSVLQARYQIVRELGSGGFATVYLAQDMRLHGRSVAIKEFNAAKLPPVDQGWARQSFQNEARVLAGLNHESIAAVTDFFSSGGLDYLVMEYVAGETLTQAWERAGRRFHPDQALTWAQELCRALEYLHRQNPPIIFRDLKPDNIMVQPDGRLKIVDFGIARHFKPGQTQDTRALGTPGYASPEHYGQGQTDTRSDIYSLAVVLHQLLTGYDPTLAPMNLPDVLALNPTIAPNIAAAIQKALNPNPNQRFSQAREFAAALVVPMASSTGPSMPPTMVKPPVRRIWAWPALGIAVFLSLISGGWVVWNGQQRAGITPTVIVSAQAVTVTAADMTVPPEPSVTLAGATEIVQITPEPAQTATTAPTPLPTAVPTALPTPIPTAIPTPTPLPANDRPIVFDSTRDVPQAEIYIMNADGSNPRRLTNNSVQDDEADLSPDGQWIAFDRGDSGTESIWLMRSDGSDARSSARGRSPDWSPDGRYLAYESLGDRPHIWLLEISTGASRPLTSGSRPYRAPDWSPDGQEIVAMSRLSSDWQIVIINVATGAERQVTSGSGDKRFPAWSPDGRLIAYNTLDSSGWPDDIWIIETSGSGARAITSRGNNGRPTWSPDGQYLVFNNYIDRRWALYRADVNGQQGEQLTNGGHDQRASWSN
jgi:tRNA A-37 threonylcarbamoyl transferase component Bud32